MSDPETEEYKDEGTSRHSANRCPGSLILPAMQRWETIDSRMTIDEEDNYLGYIQDPSALSINRRYCSNRITRCNSISPRSVTLNSVSPEVSKFPKDLPRPQLIMRSTQLV